MRAVRCKCGVVAVLALVISGCAGHSVERTKAWEQDLRDHGIVVADKDWGRVVQVMEQICDSDNETLVLTAAEFRRTGDLQTLVIDLMHACPDRLDDVKEELRGKGKS